MRHELKVWPKPFKDLLSGGKRAEVRENDRNYDVGDVLVLREFVPAENRYTGRWVQRRVTHIQTGFGLPDGLVVLSLMEW